MNTSHLHTTRRKFLSGIGAITATSIFPNLLLAQGANKKIGVAAIGCAGKGESDLDGMAKGNEVVALCDVDANNLARAAKKYPNAKTFTDFRKMLDEVKSIEAVTVSTPDHAHYPAAMHAIATGRHVCVQKPLVNTLWECRELEKAAKKKGIITQMGNQGHTYDDNRKLKEWIAAGAIGKVKEIHVWTNRPIWPQGKDATFKKGDIPSQLDWQLWLAQTPDHPYSPDIHPFKWRGFLEWGAGAFGDMGCHHIDPPMFALDLPVPQYITADCFEMTDIAWPKGGTVKMEWKNHPKHGDVVLYWYEGKDAQNKPVVPQIPKEVGATKLSATGFMIIGDQGVIYNPHDQARNPQLWPESRATDFLADEPPKTLPRSPKAGNPQEEWTYAIKQGKELDFMGHFGYSGPLTELCLVGALAMYFNKQRLEWDTASLKCKNLAEANKYIKRAKYRDGWEYSADKI